MTARNIQDLLKYKHREDIYVPECKNGPTWGTEHLRLDGLAIKRSWSNPAVIGYEIKVNRSDFLQDEKVQNYLDYCNSLYFVCPTGLITPEEIPEGMGLMWVSKTGTRLYTKRKAPYRDVEIPAALYKYILISRTKILDHDVSEGRNGGKEYWEQWLIHKKLDYEFGNRVGVAINRRIREEIRAVRKEVKDIKRENETLNEVKQVLKCEGIDYGLGRWMVLQNVRNRVREIKGELPPGFERHVSDTISSLEKIKETLGGD